MIDDANEVRELDLSRIEVIEIVDTQHLMTVGEQPLAKMRTDKAGTTRYNNAHCGTNSAQYGALPVGRTGWSEKSTGPPHVGDRSLRSRARARCGNVGETSVSTYSPWDHPEVGLGLRKLRLLGSNDLPFAAQGFRADCQSCASATANAACTGRSAGPY